MSYRGIDPAPPLDQFVKRIWIFESDGTDEGHERVLPTGTVELIVDLRGAGLPVFRMGSLTSFERQPGPLVYGPHSEFFVIDRRAPTWVLGIHFRPGGTAPFFPLPASELHNLVLPLDLLWGRHARLLAERVQAAPSDAARYQAVRQALLERLQWARSPHPAVAWALRELRDGPPAPTIAALTSQIGLSQRRFGQVFAADVGLPPKLYHRVLRFQEILTRVERAERVVWADLALECGYYDQAHFIHDFRGFAGVSPTAYLTGRGQWLNHLPIAELE